LVIVFSIIITIQYRTLRGYKRKYNLMFKTVFGSEFDKKLQRAVKEKLNESDTSEALNDKET
jgi:hypothetical protein